MSIVRMALQGTLKRLAAVICTHPKKILWVSIVLAIVSVYLTSTRLGVVNDTNSLIRKDSPALKYFLDYQKEFQAKDPMIVVVESPDFEQNRLFVEALAQRISPRKEDFAEVYYRNDLSKLRPHFLLFEDKEKLLAILDQLKSQKKLLSTQSSAQDVNLNSLLDEGLRQFDEVAKKKGKKGSLENLDVFADRMVSNLEKLAKELEKPVSEEKNSAIASLGISEGEAELSRQILLNTYLNFEDGKLLLITLTPNAGNVKSFAPYEDIIKRLRADIQVVSKDFPSVKVLLTGEPVLMDDELKQSEKHMQVAFILAFILIAVVFFFCYSEFVRPLLALAALGIALCWSYGFTVLTVGHLNIISQAFVLMMLGLGIDFDIQILGRYEEARKEGLDVEGAIETALQYTGTAVVTGGGITAIAFFTMCFNDFLGLAELGVIAGSGLIFCIISSLVVLPVLLLLRDKGRNTHVPDHESKTSFGERVDKMLFARPGIIIAGTLVLTVLLVTQIRKVHFDYNLLNLQNPKLESVEGVHRLLNSSAKSFIYGIVVAENMDDARTKAAELEALPTVLMVNTPTRMIPADQEEKLQILQKISEQLKDIKVNTNVAANVDVERARVGLQKLLDYSLEGQAQAIKFKKVKDPRVEMALKIFDRLIPALQRSLNSLQSLSQAEAGKRLNRFQLSLFSSIKDDLDFLRGFDFVNPVTLSDLPAEAAEHYISPNGKVLLEVIPRENIWDREPNERFVKDLRKVSAEATGTPVQNYVYIEILKESYVQAAIWAILAIVIMVGLHFKSLSRLFLTLLPLGIAMLWTLGIMGLFGISFNPANIITLPLAIGIGVAYGVYIIDRHLEEGRATLFESSTGKAILLSAYTTIVSFACMLCGSYPGLVSLGLLMSIAITLCFATGTFILPQFLVLKDRRRAAKKKA